MENFANIFHKQGVLQVEGGCIKTKLTIHINVRAKETERKLIGQELSRGTTKQYQSFD